MQFDGSRRSFAKHVAAPTAAALCLLALVVAALLSWSTAQADQIERERQFQLAAFVVRQETDAVGYQQEASTVWDESITRLRAPALDLEWFDNNLGIWLHSYYGHDQAYILDPDGRAVYAMRDGKRINPPTGGETLSVIAPLAAELRARLLKGDYEAPEGAQSPGVTELVTIGGHPSILSVKPIVSDTGKISLAPGSEHFHVSLQYLDSSFARKLETDYWLEAARFENARRYPDKRVYLEIKSRDGGRVGYLSWRPHRPGAEIASRLGPALISALLFVGVLAAWLLLRLHRSAAELRASEAQAQHLAFHDALTGLPNRTLFSERCDEALRQVSADHPVAILLIDLDRFKHVNDSFGHVAGDALIREFAKRLSSIVPSSDTVARLGGDEFVVLLRGVRTKAEAAELCDRILAAVRAPFDVIGNEAFVGASIGAVMAPDSGIERVELLRKADIALYRSKNEGRNRYTFFTGSMDEGVRLRGMIEDELRSALARGGEGLRVFYQPQTSCLERKVMGLEALVRWEHPERGLVPPEQFIPVAEETGLISGLGEWVVRQAFDFSARTPDLYIAVNLSPVQFRQAGFAARILALSQECGADPRRIQLEITEGVLLGNEEAVKDTLCTLRSAGFKIVLDDFGTGYSSLRYLRNFNVDKIKIDRSFVEHLGYQVDSAAIVSAVVTLGHAMGLTVTAEGVETIEQCRFVTSIGCDEMQGYLISRAVPEDELETMLADCDRRRVAA